MADAITMAPTFTSVSTLDDAETGFGRTTRDDPGEIRAHGETAVDHADVEPSTRTLIADGKLVRAAIRESIREVRGITRDLRTTVSQTESVAHARSGPANKLVELTRTTIRAHERERMRIARELHDDICQRIALLAIQLRGLINTSPRSKLGFDVLDVCCQLDELAADVQAMSRRLHSGKVEILGLAAAADSLCRQLAFQYGVAITFRHTGLPDRLPNPLALGLFRVLQEALSNGIRHSGVREFAVALNGDAAEVCLEVTDGGVGFEPSTAESGRGLGLISMHERLAMLDGELSIESRPGVGTTVTARAPLDLHPFVS